MRRLRLLGLAPPLPPAPYTFMTCCWLKHLTRNGTITCWAVPCGTNSTSRNMAAMRWGWHRVVTALTPVDRSIVSVDIANDFASHALRCWHYLWKHTVEIPTKETICKWEKLNSVMMCGSTRCDNKVPGLMLLCKYGSAHKEMIIDFC
jgi:hypothetical protein